MIREAADCDISSLCELMSELSGGGHISGPDMQNRMRMLEESMTDRVYVYEQDAKVQGVLVLRIRENIREVSRYGEICVIVVHAEAKRRGIGRELMVFAEQRAIELGCKAAYLISGFGRKNEAHPFYLELGYEITGYRFIKPLERSSTDESAAPAAFS
ncbi:hypothetical protein PAECIP111893_01747 [Paenibacillus plantiphilus]|uniref:N-acetyltransferase domain-containing protein n=1 Tax=Paenibacillus plantiphilus TaxID=2905650 RepID=A0ABM9C1W1_9BACL|nr:GNAT family N-acetyltransferase [Paenibacillus plantiphilus]CAH1201850.1 hypothetical protein PAECIP111893_01747 [Paenibacillus plantiphilus]